MRKSNLLEDFNILVYLFTVKRFNEIRNQNNRMNGDYIKIFYYFFMGISIDFDARSSAIIWLY